MFATMLASAIAAASFAISTATPTIVYSKQKARTTYTTVVRPSQGCFAKCRFSTCPSSGLFALSTPDKAFTPPICSKDVSVGQVGETGEAYLVTDGRPVRISKYAPHGLKQSFSPSFFKSYSVDGHAKLSGIGHEAPQQNQAFFPGGKCVVLPLKAYRVLGKQGNVEKNIHPTDDLVDCVSFEVKGYGDHASRPAGPRPVTLTMPTHTVTTTISKATYSKAPVYPSEPTRPATRTMPTHTMPTTKPTPSHPKPTVYPTKPTKAAHPTKYVDV